MLRLLLLAATMIGSAPTQTATSAINESAIRAQSQRLDRAFERKDFAVWLSVLLNPNGATPCHPGTDVSIDLARERAQGVVEAIQHDNRKIILPTPAIAELLTAIGPEAQQYLSIVAKSRVFEIAAFDARAAIELAYLNPGVFKKVDDANAAEPYQKRKVDRQIVAICVVAGATEIYTDDRGLANSARLCGILPKSLSECPIPDEARQRDMFLEQHDAIPEADDDGEEREPIRQVQGSRSRA